MWGRQLSLQLSSSLIQPNVAGLILAGLADFKTELSQSDTLEALEMGAVEILLVCEKFGCESIWLKHSVAEENVRKLTSFRNAASNAKLEV